MSQKVHKAAWRRLLAALRHVPEGLYHYTLGKIQSQFLSHQLEKERIQLDWDDSSAKVVVRGPGKQQVFDPSAIGSFEQRIVESIRAETARLNRNNVTRTQAYYDIYRASPELHWAFLAHMVSRNGGWNMTDLKGSLLPRLLQRQQTENLFAFLERANALIFQDAYPQLRLYQESVRLGRPAFHLLPHFHVSAFMRPAWEQFWTKRSSSVLTVALIVNEQHYIEDRIVRNEHYRRTVLETPAFKAQSLLQLNLVAFPYGADSEGRAKLAGLVLEDFSDLSERIEFGKSLYAMLFGTEEIRSGAEHFAAKHPHTGSRADYWPRLFARVNPDRPGEPFTEKLDGCKLRPQATRFFSPDLSNAWNDRPIAPPERYDWYPSAEAKGHVKCPRLPASIEITNEYCFAMNKIELAVLGNQLL